MSFSWLDLLLVTLLSIGPLDGTSILVLQGTQVERDAAEESDELWRSGSHRCSVGGVEREFILDIPEKLEPGASLLWVFHGYAGSAKSMRDSSGFADVCRAQQVIVVYPQGTIDSRGNAFFNVGYAFHRDQKVDDVLFVRELSSRLVSDLNLERHAVFATGMSNGGDISYFLAAQEEPLVQAIAPVAGTMMRSWGDSFAPKKRIPVFAVHGTDDDITRWEGDPDNHDAWGGYLGVESVRELWTRGLGLEKSSVEKLPKTDPNDHSIALHRWVTDRDRTEFRLYVIQGGGHVWPSHLGDPKRSTAQEIWSFFQAQLPK